MAASARSIPSPLTRPFLLAFCLYHRKLQLLLYAVHTMQARAEPSTGVDLGKKGRPMRFSRISIDPRICHGQACVKGTRIPVHQVVRMLANGDTVEGLLRAYPHIELADINACLEYAATLAEEQVTPIERVAG